MNFGEDEDEGPMIAPRRQKRINRKTKLHIVFDEEARREFLTGFHKRKLQRRRAAQEELKNQLKAEKKRIKLESKEQYKKLVQSYKPIPELEEQFAEEYEVDDAKVSVLELDTDLLAETNFLIGRNRGPVEKETVKEEEEQESEEENLPGMELKSKSEVKKAIKQNATKIVKKSKVFQKMNKLEQQKQKKKSMRQKRENMKIKAKGQKGKKKRFKNRNAPGK